VAVQAPAERVSRSAAKAARRPVACNRVLGAFQTRFPCTGYAFGGREFKIISALYFHASREPQL